MTLVIKNLYICTEEDSSNLAFLAMTEIKTIINLSTKILNNNNSNFNIVNVNYSDETNQNLNENNKLYTSLQNIEKSLSLNENVLVYCKDGKNVSATIIIAYLMSKYKWSYDYAFLYVKNKKNNILPSSSFTTQLKEIHQPFFAYTSPHQLIDNNFKNSYKMGL